MWPWKKRKVGVKRTTMRDLAQARDAWRTMLEHYPGGREQFDKDRKEKDKLWVLHNAMISMRDKSGPEHVGRVVDAMWNELSPEDQKKLARQSTEELVLLEYCCNHYGIAFEPEMTESGARMRLVQRK
jgi:hypothetical protein